MLSRCPVIAPAADELFAGHLHVACVTNVDSTQAKVSERWL